MKKIGKTKIIWIVSSIFFGLLLIGGFFVYTAWRLVLKPNVAIPKGEFFVCVPSNSNFDALKDTLMKNNLLIDVSSFEWLARKKNFVQKVPPGRYKIHDGMNNYELIKKFRSGAQDPVNLMFHNIDDVEELVQCVSRQIEADSCELIEMLTDENFLKQYGVTPATVFVMFIPNTYQFYWNTSAKHFMDRMKKESDKFWNEPRVALAKKIQLTRVEVVTLASIVEKETHFDKEKPKIAGVYINRLRSGWTLQADPTVKFALGNPALKRVLYRHIQTDSPYNTYKYQGLPPGPICLPSIASIEAVLNYERSNYYFFCAKPDLSGHEFSRTLSEHNRYAELYRRYQFNQTDSFSSNGVSDSVEEVR